MKFGSGPELYWICFGIVCSTPTIFSELQKFTSYKYLKYYISFHPERTAWIWGYNGKQKNLCRLFPNKQHFLTFWHTLTVSFQICANLRLVLTSSFWSFNINASRTVKSCNDVHSLKFIVLENGFSENSWKNLIKKLSNKTCVAKGEIQV